MLSPPAPRPPSSLHGQRDTPCSSQGTEYATPMTVQGFIHDSEERWYEFSGPRIEAWERDVGCLLAKLDYKITKTFSQLEAYRTEVERLVRTSPLAAERAVRNAVLKNLSTAEVLLSVLDMQQRALADDVTASLYNTLLELCTADLGGVADALGCEVDCPQVTFRVMTLVKREVEVRREWIDDQFKYRRTKVRRNVARLNRGFQSLLAMPMRRAVSGNVLRGSAPSAAELLSGDDGDGEPLAPVERPAQRTSLWAALSGSLPGTARAALVPQASAASAPAAAQMPQARPRQQARQQQHAVIGRLSALWRTTTK